MQVLETAEGINFSPLLRRYSLEEFWALPEPKDRSHYDLIGGFLFMVPSPGPSHDSIDARMVRLLMKFLIDNKIGGDVHHPQAPIYRQDEHPTYLQPDMMYVSDEFRDCMGDKRTSADIVFEYLSKSTAVYDRTTKADTYLALGVRELWLIDPVTSSIEVRHAHRKAERPVWEILRYSSGDSAASRVLQGWVVSVDEVFEGLV
jgi:Uma2 family endonuclease